MAKLPYSRVVNVNLTRVENFAARRGFGVALILTNVAKAGKVDATTRTKVYGSMDEVAADWSASDEAYKAAQEAFSQKPRPIQVKIGYSSVTVGTATIAQMKTDLDAINAFDAEWYWLTITAPFRDIANVNDGIIQWIQAQNKFAMLDSNAVATQTPGDTTSVAGRNKALYDRTAIFYHTDATEYGGVALAAYCGTRNFDNANSAYTAKFKKLTGVAPLNLGSAAIQAITGFTPALGESTTAGNCANTQVDIGGSLFVVEGTTLTPNVFIDTVHATDWIIARTEEETLNVLTNNDRIPFTDAGLEALASGARVVMDMANRAGLIANDIDPETGLYAPSVEYIIPDALSVPASQRAARIAPAIQINFRYAGAVHYTTINYRMSF